MKRVSLWILVLVVILVAARAALPWGLKRYINQTLDSIPGYYGHVTDVDVALWRGSYQIQGVELLKTKADAREPFFAADEIDISLDWRALFKGRLVTKIGLFHPQLNFIQRATKETSQTSIDESWQQKVTKLYPFEINRFLIYDGFIRYKDQTRDPKVNMYIDSVDLQAENISNATRLAARLPSTLNLDAKFLKSGKIKVKSKLNMLSEPSEFDVNAALDGLQLKEINDFAQAYGNFDFEKGHLDVAFELAASKKKYDGYVKTVMQGVDIADWKKELKKGDSVGHLLWEGLVGTITEIFENQRRDRFAARIPLSGTREDLRIDSWATVGSILRNAFIKAMSPDLEQSIDFKDAVQGSTSSTKDTDAKPKPKK